jgi:hypothetical protein
MALLLIVDLLRKLNLEKLQDSHGTDLKIPTTKHYHLRQNLETKKTALSLHDTNQEEWSFFDQGSYSDPNNGSISPQAYRELEIPTQQFNGDELLIVARINQLLKNREEKSPIRVVDAGGMYGLSWVKIAT